MFENLTAPHASVIGRFPLFPTLFPSEKTPIARKTPLRRLTAASALGQARLDTKQQQDLTKALSKAGPLELPALLPAFEKCKDADVGRALLHALKQAPALASVSPGTTPSIVTRPSASLPQTNVTSVTSPDFSQSVQRSTSSPAARTPTAGAVRLGTGHRPPPSTSARCACTRHQPSRW